MSRRNGDSAPGWARGPARPLAPIGELHVWHADLDDASRSPELLSMLCSQEELARAADMRDERSRLRFLVRRGLHRMLMGGYAVGNHRLELQTAATHLGGDALFAFCRSPGLGSAIVPVPDDDPTLARLPGLTNRERLAAKRLPVEVRGPTVCGLIAAKEALGSARGRGLDVTMQELELFDPVGPFEDGRVFCAEVEGLTWSGVLLALAEDRVACVVHAGGPRAMRVWQMGA